MRPEDRSFQSITQVRDKLPSVSNKRNTRKGGVREVDEGVVAGEIRDVSHGVLEEGAGGPGKKPGFISKYEEDTTRIWKKDRDAVNLCQKAGAEPEVPGERLPGTKERWWWPRLGKKQWRWTGKSTQKIFLRPMFFSSLYMGWKWEGVWEHKEPSETQSHFCSSPIANSYC